MRFQTPALGALALATAAKGFTPALTIGTDILAANGLLNLGIYEFEEALAGNTTNCTLANVKIRREWYVHPTLCPLPSTSLLMRR
jgi:hypothetical protein